MPNFAPDAWVARAGIRASAEDRARIGQENWSSWVDWQLALPVRDADAEAAIAEAKLQIAYDATEGFPAISDHRALTLVNKPLGEVWHLADWSKKMPWPERVRPADEVQTATIIRATVSQAQVRESVTDFWRDHFNVSRYASEDVAVALPTFDQDVLRAHAFGNFRDFLEAVATSTAMLSYLNNASSKASPANENYARELFELHTLGADAYLNAHFDRWRAVPGALEGKPAGYIDQDVYEAARAFTGWTYEAGQWIAEGVELPKTGAFHYLEAWHDPYQKRLLAAEFDAYAGPMADGRRALDLAAFHPATARNIARKLCLRFVSDTPSEELVAGAAEVFTETSRAADQIKQTLRFVFLSEEFKSAPPRLQRPLFLFASLQRDAGIMLPPSADHVWLLDGMGQKLYSWPTPAGHPITSPYWQSPGFLVRRWRAHMDFWQRIMAVKADASWDSLDAFAGEWSDRLGADWRVQSHVRGILREHAGTETRAISFKQDDRWMAAQALSLMTASPTYQAV